MTTPNDVKCNTCGHVNLLGSSFCQNCGALLPVIDVTAAVAALGRPFSAPPAPAGKLSSAKSGRRVIFHQIDPLDGRRTGLSWQPAIGFSEWRIGRNDFTHQGPNGQPDPVVVDTDLSALDDSRGFRISRRHALLRDDGNRVTLADWLFEQEGKVTRFGTWVNGRQIEGAVELRDGDKVRFGDHLYFGIEMTN